MPENLSQKSITFVVFFPDMMTIKLKSNLYALAMAVAVFVQLLAFRSQPGLDELDFRYWLAMAAADTLMFTLPYFFLSPKWRPLLLIPTLFLPVFLFGNLLYYRNFSILPTGNALASGSVFNELVINSAVASTGLADLVFLISPLILAVLFFAWRTAICSCRYSPHLRVTCAAVFCLWPLWYGTFITRRMFYMLHREEQSLPNAFAKLKVVFNDRYSTTSVYTHMGLPLHILRFALDLKPENYELSDCQKQNAIEFLSQRAAEPHRSLAHNAGKNLIVLIVESLNSSVLALPDSLGVTPTLKALAGDSTVLYVPSVASQIGVGSSSDGQLMYNCGLLPLPDEPFTARYAIADYPSLAKSLRNHIAQECIVEDPTVWNHSLTSLSFGYSKLISGLKKIGQRSSDKTAFSRALDLAAELPEPFFIQVTTLEMHSPYTDTPANPGLDFANPGFGRFSQEDKNYLERTRSFDSALGYFLDGLKAKGLAENTVVVIIGDHPVPANYVSPELDCDFVPLFILNSGAPQVYSSTIGQIDVFPTLLDVMGVDEYFVPRLGTDYRGMGTSIFAENPPQRAVGVLGEAYSGGRKVPAVDSDSSARKACGISSQLIRSRFFSK